MDRFRNPLRGDPTAGTEIHRVDNRFIPVRPTELVRTLAEDEQRFGPTAGRVADVARAIRDVIDQEAVSLEREVTEIYSLFDPDRDTVALDDLDRQRTPEAYRALLDWLSYLLAKANFVKLSDVQIQAAVTAANSHGFKVRINPDRVEHIGIWVRGRGKRTTCNRTLRHPIKGESRRLEVYRRLIVTVRLIDDPHVLVKVFKDIPQVDIEALLPHAEVEMNWFDRLMMLGGGAGAAGTTGMKVFGMIAKVAALSKLAWVLLIGLVTILVRTFLGYKRAKKSRDSQRTQHLYYQNLSNNAGAIHCLIAMIAEEEAKEAILGYAFCRAFLEPVHDEVAFRTRIEVFLRTRFHALVDFDVPDALETLTRLNLWTNRAEFEVAGPDEAICRLQDHWAARRSTTYHAECVARSRSGLNPKLKLHRD
jgi:hypothetical protein